jgi:hypothetical protein
VWQTEKRRTTSRGLVEETRKQLRESQTASEHLPSAQQFQSEERRRAHPLEEESPSLCGGSGVGPRNREQKLGQCSWIVSEMQAMLPHKVGLVGGELTQRIVSEDQIESGEFGIAGKKVLHRWTG